MKTYRLLVGFAVLCAALTTAVVSYSEDASQSLEQRLSFLERKLEMSQAEVAANAWSVSIGI